MLSLTDLQTAFTHQDAAEKQRILLIVNGYLVQKGVRVTKPIPDAIVQAGVELAQGFIKGEILAGRDEGVVVAKSSKAGEVSVSKTYANGQDGQKMGSHQMIADLLLAPFIAKAGLTVAVGRY